LFGKADTTATNDYSLTINNMPVGTFLVSFTGSFHAQSSVAGNATTCTFSISDSVGGTNIAATIQYSNGDASIGNQLIVASGGSGLYTNNSVANKTFTIQAFRNAGGGSCFGYADTNIPVTITITPLDQPSNSALYVQGPVLGAQTGAAIPAGYLGQKISDGFNIANGCTGTANTRTLATPLPPGVWLQSTSLDNASAGTGQFSWYPSNSNIAYQEVFGASGSAVRTQFSSDIAILANTSTVTSYTYACLNTTGFNVQLATEFIRLN
jgi:hypothetical protein